MAIRKVSQLTQCEGTQSTKPTDLNKIGILNNPNLANSFFEISYNSNPTGSNDQVSIGVYDSQKITYKQLFQDITNNIYKDTSYIEGSKYFGLFPETVTGDDWFENINGQVSAINCFKVKSNYNYNISQETLISTTSCLIRANHLSEYGLSTNIAGKSIAIQSDGGNKNGDCISLRSRQHGILFEIPNNPQTPETDYGWHPEAQMDSNGYWTFKKPIHGVAMSALWADLAEVYDADENYQPGTLVKFGGDAEITVADKNVNAVISTNPAFLMNSGELKYKNKVPVALLGRVPVRIKGKINKFDRIILSDVPGVGVRKPWYSLKKSIGVALESNDETDEKLVLCSIKLRI